MVWEAALNVSENTFLNEQLKKILHKCDECVPLIGVQFLSSYNQTLAFKRERSTYRLSKCFIVVIAMKLLTNNYLISTPFSRAAEGSYQI